MQMNLTYNLKISIMILVAILAICGCIKIEEPIKTIKVPDYMK